MSKNTYTVGQTVYRICTEGKGNTTVTKLTVQSVGRKWATAVGQPAYRVVKFDLATGKVDGLNTGYGPGQVVTDLAAYETEQATRAAWKALYIAIDRNRSSIPNGVTLEAIEQAATLLGLKLEDNQ